MALTGLLVGIGRLLWLTARAEPVRDRRWTRIARDVSEHYGLPRPVSIVRTDASTLLATWGFRPRVILPVHALGWSDERIHVVLCHELAHIRRHDWVLQTAAELLRAIYWFNPLLWVACARLRCESEHACDDAVLRAGVLPRVYAAHLSDLARSCRHSTPTVAAAMSMARPSTLQGRIAAMLNPGLNREGLSRGEIVVTAVVLLAMTLPIAAFRAAQDSPAPLSGSVYDTTGAALAQVELTLEDAQHLKLQATTDGSGHFEFGAVAPGTYVIEAALPGFRRLRYQLALRRARDWNQVITLQVGDVTESIVVRATRAAAPPTPRSEGPAPIRVGGNIRPPMKVKDVHPVYPMSMREAGLEGVVPMQAIIARDGTVMSVRVLSAQVHPDLAAAAVTAVRQWRYEPTLLNGVPVEVVMTVAVDFGLSD
jgi:TonB family protein